MPKKQTEAVQEEAHEEAAAEPCGHVDRHSIGIDSKPDNPACTLPAGHAGDHYATHKARVEVDRIYERESGKLMKVEYEIQDVDCYWNDAASVPAKNIEKGKLPSRNKKSEIMQVVEELMR